jgi:hypothetical protein
MNKEQLEKLSDFEINVKICESLGIKYEEGLDVLFAAGKSTGDNVVAVMGPVDYCNNPSDMMPLVFEAGISLIAPDYELKGDWRARSEVEESRHEPMMWTHESSHANPLRAAAIVYLLMQNQSK